MASKKRRDEPKERAAALLRQMRWFPARARQDDPDDPVAAAAAMYEVAITARDIFDDLVLAARETEHTWDTISGETGLSVPGCFKAAQRAEARQSQQNQDSDQPENG